MEEPGSALIREWSLGSSATGLATVVGGELEPANPRFEQFAGLKGNWRWLTGPHASVSYSSLAELVRTEALVLMGHHSVARFECAGRVLELRFERPQKSLGVVVLALDVTDELRRQTLQQRDRESLMHDEHLQAMGVLASGVAHDLNHALNVMALRIATMRADPLVGSAHRPLQALARVVTDAAAIVGRLQDLARRRRDRPRDPVDLSAVLTGAIEMARTEADAAGVRIEAHVPSLPLVHGSAAELSHVFMSMLTRARDQMPGGGCVRIHAHQEDGRVFVTIADEGAGLREHELARLFDPFAGGRRDLGLSIAYGVMARLGGSIRASSAPLRGTEFTLVFPLARAPQRPERVLAPPRPHRVLLIDDEADNLEVLRELLQLEGQDVETAQSGPSALNLFRKGEEFDLVLCDVGMPEMSGWQVAREIQELAHGTPVYMLTGWANEIGAKDARRNLVRGVLAKPLDLDILRELLARPREEREAASLTH